jgi:sugar/nucleoside kinase (ribokinase family)
MAVDILCVGVVVADAVGLTIDSFPEEGSLMVFDRVEMHLGGCPANTAVGLARLGIRAGVAAKVGKDGLGDFIRNTLRGNGVDVSGVKVDSRVATSFSFIMVPEGGNRRIYHTFGANGTFSPEDVDLRIFKGPKWIAFGCLSLMPKLFGKNLATLLKAAHKAGAKTAGDTAFNSKLKHWDAVFKGCLEHFDVFFPSEEEAVKVTGLTKPRDIVQNLRDRGVKVAGVKLGAQGCAVLCDDGYEEIPAYKVKCVDTLGAGDSFFAGFLAGLHRGRHPFDAARLGCAVAAHSVQAVGATTGIPKLPVVEAFMKRQKRG